MFNWVNILLKRWDDVARIRTKFRDEGSKKIPGCTSIEVNGIVHEFLASDKTHPMSDKIYAMLEETNRLLDSYGHVPDTSLVLYNIDNELKECVVSQHSERLAIAFGLISTKPGTQIRIMKNLRKRTKDMLTSKWHTLNANFQKFNAAYKRAKRLGKSGENDVDVMKRAQSIFRDEHKGVAFCQEDAWDLFGHDARPRPAGRPRPSKKTKSDATASTGGSSASTQFEKLMEQELRLKREAAERAFEAQTEKDRTLMRLEHHHTFLPNVMGRLVDVRPVITFYFCTKNKM
nr:hypothetical protein [Tanacetum cinerariifolium]